MGGREKEKFVTRRKTWKLQDADMRTVFEVKVPESWVSGLKDGYVWERYKYKDSVLAMADEVCGWMKVKCWHGETWWWDECIRKALEDNLERFKKCNRDSGTRW